MLIFNVLAQGRKRFIILVVRCRGRVGAADFILRRNLIDSGSLTSHLPAQATT